MRVDNPLARLFAAMTRTNTSSWTKFNNTTASFAFTRHEDKHVTVITVPPGSDWNSDLHWHESHTEYLQVKKGTAAVTLLGRQLAVTSDSDPVTVPRGTLHQWGRDASDDSVLEVWEWTDPSDGEEELFFRNLFSSILDMSRDPAAVHSSARAAAWLPAAVTFWLQLMVVFAAFDNYPATLTGYRGMDISRMVVTWGAAAGRYVGLRASHPEYVPVRRENKKSA